MLMGRPVSAGLFLTLVDCAWIDRVLIEALGHAARRNGGLPRQAEEVFAQIHQAADQFRASVLVEGGSGTSGDSFGSAPAPSVSTERLSTQEAAKLTGFSDSYWRRLARRGDVPASRSGRRGEWVFDGSAVAAWAADRDEVRQAS